jgi:hypothetical protein
LTTAERSCTEAEIDRMVIELYQLTDLAQVLVGK